MRLADLQKLDDDALGQALASAFDDLPAADPVRLASVRDRLPLPTKTPTRANRWAQVITIGMLTGSGLAAAWWGYEKLFSPEQPVAESQPGKSQQSQPLLNRSPSQAEEQQDNTAKQGDDRRSPIIYQQERF